MLRYRNMEAMKYIMTEVLKYRNTKHREVTMISEIGHSTGKR